MIGLKIYKFKIKILWMIKYLKYNTTSSCIYKKQKTTVFCPNYKKHIALLYY